jgi:hypothetical protein
MSIAVVSYSLTGNNEVLAEHVARALSAKLINVSEPTPRSKGKIARDMFLGLTPKVRPAPDCLSQFDCVLFIAPVWMEQAASPLRVYFRYLRAHPKKCAFASISGGALTPNPKLALHLEKRLGQKPAAVVDLHIVDLLPPEPKPTAKETSAFVLDDETAARLAQTIVQVMHEKLAD